VKDAISQFLSPLPPPGAPALPDAVPVADVPEPSLLQVDGGWPLGKNVLRLEVLAVASRVTGVLLVNDVFLSNDKVNGTHTDDVPIGGLQLPRLAGLSVGTGDPIDIMDMISAAPSPVTPPGGGGGGVLPIPVVPEDC
jgi:hypothetical protein